MERPGQSSQTIYPVSSYTFGTKQPKFEKDVSVAQRMERLKEKYQREGVRRTVDGVLVVHEHNHPHILLVQVGSSFFKLPGGRLRPGEDEMEGLLRKLNNLLAPQAANFRPTWHVGECLATYYRPNFENTVYPYCPAHVTRPKEIKHIWHIVLPERSYFSIPKNMRLVAVPLFEVYDNPQRYGPIIASIPALLSRFQFTLAGAKGYSQAEAWAGGLPQTGSMPAGGRAGQEQEQQHNGDMQPQQQHMIAHQQQQPHQPQQQQQYAQQQAAAQGAQQSIVVNFHPQQQQQPEAMDSGIGMQQHAGMPEPLQQQQQQAYLQQQQADNLFVDFDE